MRIVFSFDDNHILNMKVADLLEKYGFKATFFINIFPIRNHIGLSTRRIKNLYERGFEIGAHTIAHKLMLLQHPVQRIYELQRSKKLLETLTGAEVTGFSYPKGQYNQKIISEVKMAGYKYARTVGEGCLSIRDQYQIVPAIQIYNRPYRRGLRVKSNILNGTGFSWTGDWKESSMKYIKANKGVVHIWGHSWEIEKQDMWGELEELLQWIQKQGRECDTLNTVIQASVT